MGDNNEKNKTEKAVSAEIAVIDEHTIRDKIYVVRGVQVMLDFELAEIYGYTTSAFNQQVRRNESKFPPDFRFQLSEEEYRILLSQNVTASWGGDRRTRPWVFSESGIYMLMTVLRGELATKQSIALIRTFRSMKDYIVQNQSLINQRDYLHLSMQISDTQQAVQGIQSQLIEQGDKLNDLFGQMQEAVKRSEISPFMLDFSKPDNVKEYLILNGQPAKADETYIDIYSMAKKTIYIVDNYVSIKTLRLLQNVQLGVSVIVFTDNLRNQLHASDYADFQTEFPSIQISFQQTGRTTHDRFIVLDYGTTDERIFHCGASSKDAGIKLMTVISEMTDPDFIASFDAVIQRYLGNPALVLR